MTQPHELFRIVQILPAPPEAVVLYLDDRPDGCCLSDVICLALVDCWFSDDWDSAPPKNASRRVVPMTGGGDGIELCTGAASNEVGYFTRNEATTLLNERLAAIAAKAGTAA